MHKARPLAEAFHSLDGYYLPWDYCDTDVHVVVVVAAVVVVAVAVVVACTVVVPLLVVVACVVAVVVVYGDYFCCCCGDYFGVFPSEIDGFHLLP